MSNGLRLVVFDVDGTLVDSQADILRSMETAFSAVGRVAPDRSSILQIVGLSLPDAMAHLAPTASPKEQATLVDRYKDAYVQARSLAGAAVSSPLYPGARAMLDRLAAVPDLLLGIATGKSKRGLDHLLSAHDLERHFITAQVADFHPSKPHPAMLHAAISDAGVEAGNAVMIGDTMHDLRMADAAGIPFIAVAWGYHAIADLQAAAAIIHDFGELPSALETVWGAPLE